MDCKEAQRLIDGYVDGELDLVGSVEVESHVEDCGLCLLRLESRRALRGAIRSASLGFEPPRGLESRIGKAMRQDVRSSSRGQEWGWRRRLSVLALAVGPAAIILIVFVGLSLSRFSARSVARDDLVAEATSDHVRSLQANHLFDVASTDQHTVKPWFTGKLDYAPPVVDLKDQGFPLVGGRLDYLSSRAVAALVYHRRLHTINLFVWPANGPAEPPGEPESESLRGYHTVQWTREGMAYLAVSDVSIADLKEFAHDLIERAPRP